MVSKPRPIDVSNNPEVLRLAEEVEATLEPRLLRRGDHALALIVPLSDEGTRRPTEEDRKAFHSAAGGWADMDTDQLLEDFAESRRLTRSPVDL